MFIKGKASVWGLVAGAALVLSTLSANAATYKYILSDHEDGGRAAYDYGLRLDQTDPDRFFSFSAGNASLLYNDDAGALSAIIKGTMRESFAGANNFGASYVISYVVTGIEDLGNGSFRGTGGSGSIDGIALGAEHQMGGTDDGFSFIFRHDGHRVDNNTTDTIGRGWVSKDGGANDFLFRAELTTMPLPAAGWLLIGAFGGLAGLKRFRRKA